MTARSKKVIIGWVNDLSIIPLQYKINEWQMARNSQALDLEFHIRNNYPWSKLPPSVKQVGIIWWTKSKSRLQNWKFYPLCCFSCSFWWYYVMVLKNFCFCLSPNLANHNGKMLQLAMLHLFVLCDYIYLAHQSEFTINRYWWLVARIRDMCST